jgi:hypothetical protein
MPHTIPKAFVLINQSGKPTSEVAATKFQSVLRNKQQKLIMPKIISISSWTSPSIEQISLRTPTYPLLDKTTLKKNLATETEICTAESHAL